MVERADAQWAESILVHEEVEHVARGRGLFAGDSRPKPVARDRCACRVNSLTTAAKVKQPPLDNRVYVFKIEKWTPLANTCVSKSSLLRFTTSRSTNLSKWSRSSFRFIAQPFPRLPCGLAWRPHIGCPTKSTLAEVGRWATHSAILHGARRSERHGDWSSQRGPPGRAISHPST